MIKRYKIVLSGIMFILLVNICAGAWSTVDKIATLQEQVLALEEQKARLETEKKKLIVKGDELSFKIDELKIQAKGGLGIIGKYKLSRSLRKTQALSENIRVLEKRIHSIKNEIRDKKRELEREYERQIASLLEKLNETSQTAKKREILKKVREYQTAKKQLAEPEKEKLEHLDITKIEIQKYDGPQEIREKADLINDFAAKMKNRIDMLKIRAEKLGVEIKTRERLGEFAEEISFFGERISREEVVSNAGEAVAEEPDNVMVEQPGEKVVETDGDRTGIFMATDDVEFVKDGAAGGTSMIETEFEPPVTTVQPSETSGKMVIERDGVSASFALVSLEQIRGKIELLENQEQTLKQELVVLLEKANSFYKKADEIEKSETKQGGKGMR